MARREGTLKLSSNIEPRAAAPLDARTIVPTLAELTASGTFSYPYVGMIVSVQSEGKAYMLTADDTTVADNWTAVSDSPTFNEDDFNVVNNEVSLTPEQRIFSGTKSSWDVVQNKTNYRVCILTDD